MTREHSSSDATQSKFGVTADRPRIHARAPASTKCRIGRTYRLGCHSTSPPGRVAARAVTCVWGICESHQLTPRPLISDTQSSRRVTSTSASAWPIDLRADPARRRARTPLPRAAWRTISAAGMHGVETEPAAMLPERSHRGPALLGDPTRIHGCEGRDASPVIHPLGEHRSQGQVTLVMLDQNGASAQRTPAARSRCRRSVSSRPAMAGSKPPIPVRVLRRSSRGL